MSISLEGPFLKVFLHLCEDVNTPRSLAAYMLAKNNEVIQLASLRVDPWMYPNAEAYARDAIVTEFLRKCDFADSAHSARLKASCWSRFEKTEQQCLWTNQRLSFYLDPYFPSRTEEKIYGIIRRIQKQIAWLVGPLPLSLDGGFGPGATLTNSRRRSTIPDKLGSDLCGTAPALELFDALFSNSAWTRYGGVTPDQRTREIVRGNRFFTVPKTTLSLRGACLSPNVNGFLQKGVGQYLRSTLKKVGIHIGSASMENPLGLSINDFTSKDKHVRLAASSSMDGEYATVDLSDASNTIAKNCVKLLFPEGWYTLLSSLREPFVERPDGRQQRLEMFSAMGNGFTFEVETIIFWAITRVMCPDGEVSVFGDDIICPRKYADDVLSALRFFGFTPNPDKTFTIGPFRESCGGDFFNGVPVRAHYVKSPPSAPEHWISLANGLHRLAFSDPRTNHRWSYLRRAWFACLDSIPSPLRALRGPKDLGDLVIHDTLFDQKLASLPLAYPSVDRFHRISVGKETVLVKDKGGVRSFRVYGPVSRTIRLNKWSPRVMLASALYGVPSSGVIPRDAVAGYALKWVPFS